MSSGEEYGRDLDTESLTVDVATRSGNHDSVHPKKPLKKGPHMYGGVRGSGSCQSPELSIS